MDVNEFHTSFNARHLDPIEIAENFIYSKSFNLLIQNNHSVLLGARGCGKTTLMKMLTLSALHSWKGNQAKKVREKIPFYAIYISTDIYWNVRDNKTYEQLDKFKNFPEIVSKFSVTTNILISLCNTFEEILSLEINNKSDTTQENELCIHLMKEWMLPPTVPTLPYIRESLKRRSDIFNRFVQSIIFNYSKDDTIDTTDKEYLFIDFRSSLKLVTSIFERIFGVSKKWAFCFDELELAPDWLRDDLFLSLRSTDQKIIYKLSASPIVSLSNKYPATVGNDLILIKMWESSDDTFSKKIISSIVNKNFKKHIDLKEFFHSSDIYNKDRGSYNEGSNFQNEVKSLIKKDASFRRFLLQKNVDLNNPVALDEQNKDILFRKIKPIVYFRNYFIDYVISEPSNNELQVKLRSRKTLALYSGVEVLYKICDGNPRWLIGIINTILNRIIDKSKSTDIRDIQVDVLYETAVQFMNVISNIPIEPYKTTRKQYTLEDLIQLIGLSFQNEILGPIFKMDPKGSFIVEKSEILIPEALIDFLEKAAYQGAIILLNSNDSAFDFEVRGKKFRLSYMLAPLFKLPLRTYGEINLSSCFQSKESRDLQQGNLFD